MDLVYIGDKFYRESSTIMSSIYTPDGARSDWGKVEIALSLGYSVTIRQASKPFLSKMEKRLAKIKEKLASGEL